MTVTQDFVINPRPGRWLSPVKTTAGSTLRPSKADSVGLGWSPAICTPLSQGTAAAAGLGPTLRSITVCCLLSTSHVTSQVQRHWGPLPRLLKATLSCSPCQLSSSPFYIHPNVPQGLILGFCSFTAIY